MIDIGWHMDCLDPPLDVAPKGSWICPLCEAAGLVPKVTPHPVELHLPNTPSIPGPSTSRLKDSKSVSRAADKMEVDGQGEAEVTQPVRRGRGRPKGSKKLSRDMNGKGRARATVVEDSSSPTRRVTSSPEVAGPGRRKVKLVVRKPRHIIESDEEEEEPSSPTNMFEDVLTPEQYNTTNTNILDSDKSLFNRAKTRAEVCV